MYALRREAEEREKTIGYLTISLAFSLLATGYYLWPEETKKIFNNKNTIDHPTDVMVLGHFLSLFSYACVWSSFKIYDRCKLVLFQPHHDDQNRLDEADHLAQYRGNFTFYE